MKKCLSRIVFAVAFMLACTSCTFVMCNRGMCALYENGVLGNGNPSTSASENDKGSVQSEKTNDFQTEVDASSNKDKESN